MKLICSKANLLKGVNIVSKAVPTRTTMAILECILIDASANEIKLMANDMELGIETIIDGTIEERGIIALDAKIFSEIVRKLPDNDITIVTDSSLKTNITCEKAKFTIIGKSGDDFSYLPSIERIDSIVLSQFTLKEVIRQTIFSIADNDNNKLMTGELFEIDGVELVFEQEALEAIVDKAIERKTGARGLRSIIEEIMRDIMFEIPSNPNIEKCIITKATVSDNAEPKIVINENKERLKPVAKKKRQMPKTSEKETA